MECPTCYFANKENAKFCNEWGNKVELICPECGIGNQVGSKFCNQFSQPAKPKIRRNLSAAFIPDGLIL